jgi:hypothetical protein
MLFLAFFFGVLIGIALIVFTILVNVLFGNIKIVRCSCGPNEGCYICASGKRLSTEVSLLL